MTPDVTCVAGAGPAGGGRRDACSRAPARACSWSIARRFRGPNCAATRSIPARCRCSSASVLADGVRAARAADRRHAGDREPAACASRDVIRPASTADRILRTELDRLLLEQAHRGRRRVPTGTDRARTGRGRCIAAGPGRADRQRRRLTRTARTGHDRRRWPPFRAGVRPRSDAPSAGAAALGDWRVLRATWRDLVAAARCTSARDITSASRRCRTG